MLERFCSELGVVTRAGGSDAPGPGWLLPLCGPVAVGCAPSSAPVLAPRAQDTRHFNAAQGIADGGNMRPYKPSVSTSMQH